MERPNLLRRQPTHELTEQAVTTHKSFALATTPVRMTGVRSRRSLIFGAAVFLYFAAARPRMLRWGATRQEARDVLPGDDLVPARWQTTRGVNISAPPTAVWPWLVQIGYRRGGWYSYDWLERQAGAGDFAQGGSAKFVVPELQHLEIGDTIALGPSGGPTVAVLKPPNALVLRYRMNPFTAAPADDDDHSVLDWTWTFDLTPVGEDSCRLLVRVRADYRPRLLFAFIPLVLEPIHLLMERKMLRTLQSAISSPQATVKVPGSRRSGGSDLSLAESGEVARWL
jgi:hypothetical protein